jgi:hypothetical protein
VRDAPELLEEDGRALRGPQEQHGVDLRQVDPLVEQVDGEQAVDLQCPQTAERLGALGRGRARRHGEARDPRAAEHVRHVLRVGHRDAEAERPHAPHVGDLVDGLADDLARPCVIARIDVVEGRGVVRAAAPLDPPQVDVVVNAEVVERDEQVGAQRVPQPQLVGAASAELLPDVRAVAALGRGGETEQLARGQVVEQATVGRRLGVVKLVDDHHVEVVARDLLDAVGGQGLHAREHMAPQLGVVPSDELLAERPVAQHLAVGAPRLLQDLAPVRDEQQPVPRQGLPQPVVVQGGDDCLPRAGRRDDEVAVAAVHGPLRLECLKDLRLVRVRTHLQPGQLRRGGPEPVAAERLAQPADVGEVIGVVGHERRVRPVAVEGPGELAHQLWGRHRRQPHVPFQAVDQRRAGEVAAPHESGVEAGGAPQQPRLGVQPRRRALVADPHLCAVATHQLVDRPLLGRADVGRRDDPERDTALLQQRQRLLQHPDTGPTHERAQQVDAVGGAELGTQLGAERRFLGSIGQQRGGRERRDRPQQAVHARCALPAEDDELLGGVGQPLLVCGDPVEQVVHQGEPTTRVAFLGQYARDDLGHVASEDVRDVRRVDRLAVRGEADELGEDGVEAQCPKGLVQALGQRLGHAGAPSGRERGVRHCGR